MSAMKRTSAVVITATAAVLGLSGLNVDAQDASGDLVEWPYVGSDQSHTKYSPLDDIDRSNVDQLVVAWTWDPNELPGHHAPS